jgi:hypothetical protein
VKGRAFLVGALLGGSLTALSGRQVSQLCTPGSSGARLVAPSDLAYLGSYDVQMDGPNSTYAMDLTHHYVNGDLRFLQLTLGNLVEFSLAGKNFGDLITTPTNAWDIRAALRRPDNNVNDHNGFWIEASTNRLFHTSAPDYTPNTYPAWVDTATLGAAGAVSNQHTVFVGTIPWKRMYGGCQAVPPRWQPTVGNHPYVCGFGGYTSLVMQGGSASMGPAMYAIPDPAGFADQATIPMSSITTLMDTSSPSVRGVRKTIPINYYDGGDPRPNPSTPPTVPPLTTAQWLSPDPKTGLGWMVWGDSYFNTGMWIETPTRYGFVAIASLGGGKTWYMNSSLHSDFHQYEWHIFDPATMQATGQPAAMGAFTVPGLGDPGGQANTGNNEVGSLSGATFDATTNRVYTMGCSLSTNPYLCRLYVFQLN